MGTVRKILEILTPRQRWRMFGLFGLMLLGMVMETVGVGMVVPVVSILTRDAGDSSPWAARIMEFTGLGHDDMVTWGMLGLIAVFAVKAAFLAFVTWQESSFVFSTRAELSERLFALYMNQDYTFHLGRNSAHLIRNIIHETEQFATGTMNASLVLATELLVASGIGALLIYVEPVGALVVIVVLGVASTVFAVVTRTRLEKWGRVRQHHQRYRIQHLQQALGGVKDVKLLGREQDFLDQYSTHNRGAARVGKHHYFLKTVPRLWLELLAVTGLVLLVLSMAAQGRSQAALMPTLGVFAAAAFRIMPSANRILGAINGLRFNLVVVSSIHEELKRLTRLEPRAAQSRLPLARTLELKDVSYSYPDGSEVLDHVSLVIERGTSMGFIGTSGAGKSTLVDVVMGLLAPSSGAILVDDRDVRDNLRGWQDEIGYVPQTIFLTDDSLRRNIAFGLPSERIDEAAVQRALVAARLDDFVATLPEGLDTVVGERGVRLSGGQRQRIGIARALYHDPEVLVLDEATSALDTTTEQSVMDAIVALKNKTILIIAHRLSTVARCDLVVRLESGRIVERAPASEVLGEERSAVS